MADGIFKKVSVNLLPLLHPVCTQLMFSCFPFRGKNVILLCSLDILIVHRYKACYWEAHISVAKAWLLVQPASFHYQILLYLKGLGGIISNRNMLPPQLRREPGLSQEDGLGLGREEGVYKGLSRTTRNS